jgi:type II secretory pathway pseudopilin PulG
MNTQRHSRTAFSLIEVTIALGIAAFCLLTVFGLLPIGLDSSQNAAEQTVVSGIATAISSDFHAAAQGTLVLGGTGAVTSRFGFTIPAPGRKSAFNIQGVSFQTLYFAEDGSPITNGTRNGVDQNASPGANPPRYRATVTIVPDPNLQSTAQSVNGNTTLYKAWILITWPALSDPDYATFPSNFAGSYETVTALNFFNNT